MVCFTLALTKLPLPPHLHAWPPLRCVRALTTTFISSSSTALKRETLPLSCLSSLERRDMQPSSLSIPPHVAASTVLTSSPVPKLFVPKVGEDHRDASSSFSSGTVPSSSPTDSKLDGPRIRVVIIGAGMAGLSAAVRLHQSEIAPRLELTVLEASDRVGGRVCTKQFLGEQVEMGATWIHGIDGSPLYNIAEKIGAMKSDEKWEMMDGWSLDTVFLREGGGEVPEGLVDEVAMVYQGFLDAARQQSRSDRKDAASGSVSNVGEFLEQHIQKYLEAANKGQSARSPVGGFPWDESTLRKALFTSWRNLERNISAVDSLDDLDLPSYGKYREFPGEQITIAKGYSSLPRALADTLPPGALRFGQRVTRICWGGGKGGAPVKVECEGGGSIEADHVIVTVSLGVLKERAIGGGEGGLFEPGLPDWKINAIQKLGFGVVNKLLLDFGTPSPLGEASFVQMVFRDPPPGSSQIPTWMRKAYGFFCLHKKSPIIVGWFAGQEAVELEALPPSSIREGLANALQEFGLPVETSAMGELLTSKWSTDPLFRGSYSYVPVGASELDQDALAEPLPRTGEGSSDEGECTLRVLFAGEATQRNYYSTTHGAYMSGLREAERLLVHHNALIVDEM